MKLNPPATVLSLIAIAFGYMAGQYEAKRLVHPTRVIVYYSDTGPANFSEGDGIEYPSPNGVPHYRGMNMDDK